MDMHRKERTLPPLYAPMPPREKLLSMCVSLCRAESFCRSNLCWRDLANSASNSSGDISPPSAVGAVAAAGAVDSLDACSIPAESPAAK
jgi:hypothetical protein